MSIEPSVKGLYKRNNIWWIKARINGRSLRKSTKTGDIHRAAVFRDALLSEMQQSFVSGEWKKHVLAQVGSSSSWLRRTHSRIRRRSRIRKWPNVLSKSELIHLMLQSNGKCAISGIDFERSITQSRQPTSISIDRIDSKQGYTIENCRLVLLAINLGMCEWGEEEFLGICMAVAGTSLLNRLAKRAQ